MSKKEPKELRDLKANVRMNPFGEITLSGRGTAFAMHLIEDIYHFTKALEEKECNFESVGNGEVGFFLSSSLLLSGFEIIDRSVYENLNKRVHECDRLGLMKRR